MIAHRDIDKYIVTIIQKLPVGVHPIMVLASVVGSPVASVLILISIFGASFYAHSRTIMKTSGILLICLPIAAVLKLLTQRIRPDTLFVKSMRFKSYSFPSGHAYGSFLALGFLAYLAVKYLPSPWGYVCAGSLGLLILTVGISRVYLGAHFPTDVLGGWVLGAVVLILVIKASGN